MHSDEYVTYMNSSEWAMLREAVLESVDYHCERCGRADQRLEVHHLSYDRLGYEQRDDLKAVCRPCHEIEDRERAQRTAEERLRREERRREMERWARREFGPNWRVLNRCGYIDREFEIRVALLNIGDEWWPADPPLRPARFPERVDPRPRLSMPAVAPVMEAFREFMESRR